MQKVWFIKSNHSTKYIINEADIPTDIEQTKKLYSSLTKNTEYKPILSGQYDHTNTYLAIANVEEGLGHKQKAIEYLTKYLGVKNSSSDIKQAEIKEYIQDLNIEIKVNKLEDKLYEAKKSIAELKAKNQSNSSPININLKVKYFGEKTTYSLYLSLQQLVSNSLETKEITFDNDLVNYTIP